MNAQETRRPGDKGTSRSYGFSRRAALLSPLVAWASAGIVRAADKPTAPTKAADAKNPAGVAEKPNQVRGDEITDKQKASVAKGLAWLAQAQQPDGCYSKGVSGAG